MATPEIQYTIPKVVKGKKVKGVPKGSTKAKEEANQNWYVDFFPKPEERKNGTIQTVKRLEPYQRP
jgi:hypothetical protein